MALVLIFAGSIAGILLGGIQMIFQDASVWTALTTYLSFSLGFPLSAGLIALVLTALRGPRRASGRVWPLQSLSLYAKWFLGPKELWARPIQIAAEKPPLFVAPHSHR